MTPLKKRRVANFTDMQSAHRMETPQSINDLRRGGGLVAAQLDCLPERSLRPHQRDEKRTIIYFIEALEFGRVKIGRTDDVLVRMVELQCGSPARLVLRWAYCAPTSHEFELHRRFRNLRVIGEWFSLEGGLLAYVEQRKPGLYRPSKSRKAAP